MLYAFNATELVFNWKRFLEVWNKYKSSLIRTEMKGS